MNDSLFWNVATDNLAKVQLCCARQLSVFVLKTIPGSVKQYSEEDFRTIHSRCVQLTQCLVFQVSCLNHIWGCFRSIVVEWAVNVWSITSWGWDYPFKMDGWESFMSRLHWEVSCWQEASMTALSSCAISALHLIAVLVPISIRHLLVWKRH